MFIQRSAEAGFSGVWQEKYAVLTSSYFAYYDSGAQFVSYSRLGIAHTGAGPVHLSDGVMQIWV